MIARQRCTAISNDAVEDTNLSVGALGLLVYMLSKPEGWIPNTKELSNRFKCSHPSVGRLIRELKAAGYASVVSEVTNTECEMPQIIADQCISEPPTIQSAPIKEDSEATEQAIQVYQSYPKKVGKPVALRAIAKAIDKHGVDLVLGATKFFAAAWTGGDLQYCPHPATWFNQERFLDDPSTWTHREDKNALQRNLARLKASVADSIYNHPCNRETPGYWKLCGRGAPTEAELAGYKELIEKRNDINRRLNDLGE